VAVRLLSKSEYARHRNCDEKAVRKAIKEGRITAIPQANGRELIDPEVADIQWARNTRARGDSGRPAAPAAFAGGDQALPLESVSAATETADGSLSPVPASRDDYQSLRTRRERAAVEAAERENAKEAGLLVERAAVQRGTFDAFRAFRDAVMSTPPRAAAKVVGLADSREIERVITDELRGALLAAEARLRDQLPQAEGG
jgi:hypothetical protein